MTQIEHTVTIDRPVEDVWDYVMDARNDPEWMTQRDRGRPRRRPARRASASRSRRP